MSNPISLILTDHNGNTLQVTGATVLTPAQRQALGIMLSQPLSAVLCDVNGNPLQLSSSGSSGAWASLTGDLTETQVIPFDGGTVGTPDSGISRIGAASLAIGNGVAANTSGSLTLSSLYASLVDTVAVTLTGVFTDGVGSVGTNGQVLSSTVTGTKWINAAASGVTSITGDGTILSNSGSTGAVTLTLENAGQNTVLAGPISGGTGAPTYRSLVAADIPALSYLTSPMTTLGDIIYENSTPAAARLAGNTSATKNFLTQTGTGSGSAAPVWGTIAVTDIPSNFLAPQLVQSGLLAQYNMTDSGGANGFTLTDFSGNGNNGTLGMSGTITNISKTGSVLTVTCANTFTAGNQVTFYGVGTNTVLNGNVYTISGTGLSSSQFEISGFASAITNGADTGTAVSQFPTWITASVPTNSTPQLQVSGGLQFTYTNQQFAALPTAVNNFKTVLLVTFFDPANAGGTFGSYPLAAGGTVAQGYASSLQYPSIAYYNFESVTSPSGVQNYKPTAIYSGGFGTTTIGAVHGYQVLHWVVAAGGDTVYTHSRAWPYGATLGTLNTADNPYYHLGGNKASTGNPSWFQGQILFAAFWSTDLTPAQVQQNIIAVQLMLQERGLVLPSQPATSVCGLPGTWQIPEATDTFCLDGDSETTYLQSPNLPTVTGSPNIFNTGQPGQTALTISNNASYMVDVNLPNIAYNSTISEAGQGANRAGVIVFIGTNDASTGSDTPAFALGSLANYCRSRYKAGWNKVAVVTMMDRQGDTTFKNTYDGLIRSNWANWSDVLIDVAANPNWGANGANANSFYINGGVHWSPTVSAQMAGWFYSYGMRRMYGNTLQGSPNIASSSPYLCQPEDIFWIANDAGSISAYMIPAQMFTGQTVTVKNTGSGTLTVYPKPITATVTNLALTANVITVTASNDYTAGDVIVLTGLTTNPTLNGISGIISSTGLSSSSFQFAYTHANITSASETGFAQLANYCQAAAITNIVETSGSVVTLTAANNYTSGQTVYFSGLTTGTWLNGQSATVSATGLSSSQFEFTDPTSHGTQTSHSETGIAVYNYPAETINGNSSITVASGATCILLSQISSATTGLANWITLQNS